MKASVINAGDVKPAHPTQALVDALVMRRRKKKLKGLTVACIGDIQHSRVARSNIHLLNKFGAKVRIIAPSYFMPQDLSKLGVDVFDNLKDGLKGVDVVMTQRIQLERLGQGEFAVSLKEYHQRYGLDHAKLKAAKPDAIVMNPGPVIRDVEITSELADDPKFSVIREQVALGVAIKMAVLDLLLGDGKK
jgi:aspartate carbamoyltransferase catalytic subunit